MIKTILTSIFSIILLNGCISITKELPAKKTYSLSFKNDTIKSKYHNKTIHIYEPKALTSINTKAITYSKEFEQEKYALSKWSDKPTKMIQEVLANYLVNKNSFKYITTSNIKINSDYSLVSQLVDFKQTFTNNNSYADFSIRVYLINNKTENVYFKSFTYNQKTNTNDAKGVVIAFNTITTKFLKDLDEFIISSIN